MEFDIFGVVLHIWFDIDTICQKSGTHYQTLKHMKNYISGVGGVSAMISFQIAIMESCA